MVLNERCLRLVTRIDDGSFWTVSDKEYLETIRSAFVQEVERLKYAYSDRPIATPAVSTDDLPPSVLLYGEQYDEVDRTFVGLLALRWIVNGDYEAFTCNQSPDVKLSKGSFEKLKATFGPVCSSSRMAKRNLYTLVLSMVINDLGKDPSLGQEVSERLQCDVSSENHDTILYLAVKEDMIDAVRSLDLEARQDLLIAMEVGAELNLGQVAQAECPPACLGSATKLKGHKNAWSQHFLEQLLDLAGAGGHVDHTCALKCNERVCKAFFNAFDVVEGMIDPRRNWPPRQAYDHNLAQQLKFLKENCGYRDTMHVSLQVPRTRAFLRLLCIGNVGNSELAELFEETFNERLSTNDREMLVVGLNVDGSIDEPAVLPTYIPMMTTSILDIWKDRPRDKKLDALASLWRYLSRTLHIDNALRQTLRRDGITVIERDIRKKTKPVAESPRFLKDPATLDSEEIPSWTVISTERGAMNVALD